MAAGTRMSDGGGTSRRNSTGESTVEDKGSSGGPCVYCRSAGSTYVSHYLLARSLTVDDYQDLLDRGWRRNGRYLYKPEMDITCCPSYTIRLRVAAFKPSKEQLGVCRRMKRFLDGTLNIKKPDQLIEDSSTSNDRYSRAGTGVPSSGPKESLSGENEKKDQAEPSLNYLSDQIDRVIRMSMGRGELACNLQFPKASVKKVSQAKRSLIKGSEDLLYSSNIAFQISALTRRVQSCEENELSAEVIAEKLASSLNQLAGVPDLLIRACNGHINFHSASRQHSNFQVHTASNDSAVVSARKKGYLEKSSKKRRGEKRRLEIRMKRSSFDPEEFSLYRKYQIKVHSDTPEHVTKSSYKKFLVDTPLVFVPPTGDGTVPPCGFGSFHQQYVVDGRLVAVGVIDILPRCLSSKYLFWDPDFAFLSLGKYSALQEIGWVRENEVHCPSLQYYYLGYYIHSCSKMRYKAAYRPSELLCPLRYRWTPYDSVRRHLDKRPYVILSDIPTSQNGESSPPHVSEEVLEVQHDDIGQG